MTTEQSAPTIPGMLGTYLSKKYGRVAVMLATYGGPAGPLAVVLTAEGDMLTKLSVNMYRPECSHDSKDLPPLCFYVRNWAENKEIAAEALASGLFIERPDLPQSSSGFVTAPVWQVVAAS